MIAVAVTLIVVAGVLKMIIIIVVVGKSGSATATEATGFVVGFLVLLIMLVGKNVSGKSPASKRVHHEGYKK